MGMQIDEAGRHQPAFCVDRLLRAFRRDICFDGRDFSQPNANIANSAQILAWIDHFATANDEIEWSAGLLAECRAIADGQRPGKRGRTQ